MSSSWGDIKKIYNDIYNQPKYKHVQFMQMCIAGANIFSTCSKRQYMAIITDYNNHVMGLGYNGVPKDFKHCNEGGCPRAIEGSPSGSNYDNCYAIHAEANAFLHSDYDKARRLYVNGTPCFSCAKLIANSGVVEVYYIRDEQYKQWPETEEFLSNAGIPCFDLSGDISASS